LGEHGDRLHAGVKPSYLALVSAICVLLPGADAAELPKLGASAAEVRNEMGAPTAVRSAPGKKQVWEYLGKPSPYETYFLLFSKGKLTDIRQVMTDATFAQVKAGMTEPRIRALLGTPWRITNINDDADEDIGDVWEYRGRDGAGTYKFHIEFDLHRRVVVAAKVADVAVGNNGSNLSKPATSSLPDH
jgi:hypothetical protein